MAHLLRAECAQPDCPQLIVAEVRASELRTARTIFGKGVRRRGWTCFGMKWFCARHARHPVAVYTADVLPTVQAQIARALDLPVSELPTPILKKVDAE